MWHCSIYVFMRQQDWMGFYDYFDIKDFIIKFLFNVVPHIREMFCSSATVSHVETINDTWKTTINCLCKSAAKNEWAILPSQHEGIVTLCEGVCALQCMNTWTDILRHCENNWLIYLHQGKTTDQMETGLRFYMHLSFGIYSCTQHIVTGFFSMEPAKGFPTLLIIILQRVGDNSHTNICNLDKEGIIYLLMIHYIPMMCFFWY